MSITLPSSASRRDASVSFGILSTFPPTSCGIATFSAALSAGLIGQGALVDVVRATPAPDLEDAIVLASLDQTPTSVDRAVDVLNATDLAIIQHEYGLYDGPDGNSIVCLMGRLTVPVVVVAHTVVSEPTTGQRRVLDDVCRAAEDDQGQWTRSRSWPLATPSPN